MAITALQGQWRERFGVQGQAGTYTVFAVNPSSFPTQNVAISYGTTTNRCNACTVVTTTVTAANTRSIDLTGLAAPDGSAMALTKVKTLQFGVTTAVTTGTDPYYQAGPLGISNGAILGFCGTTGGVEVHMGGVEMFATVNGWAVTAANKMLLLSNPNAYDVTASVFITGTT